MMSSAPPSRLAVAALVAVVALYLALGGVYAVSTPAFEKPDEEWHFAYVVYLLDQHRLPPLVPDEALNPARQEAGQPPLFYALAAGVLKVTGLEHARPSLRPNPYWGYPVAGTVNDNKNRYVHARDELVRPEFRAVYVLRGLSLLLGLGAVLAAFGLTAALTGSPLLGVAGAACVAVLPQYLFIASSASNDGLVASLAGGAVWLLLGALKWPARLRPWLAFGVVAGLAALTKTSGLLLPTLGAAGAICAAVRLRSGRAAWPGVFASMGGALVLAAWWYARNLLAFHDLFGTGVHLHYYGRAQPLPWSELPAQWPVFERTFWASFGWTNVLLPPWAYWLLRLIEGAAALGLLFLLADQLRAPRRPLSAVPAVSDLGHAPGARLAPALAAPTDPEHSVRPAPLPAVLTLTYRQRLVLAVLLATTAGYALAVMWWALTLQASLGRLMFPALAPLAALLIASSARLWLKLPWLVLIGLALLALLGPAFIRPAFRPPVLLPRDAPTTASAPLNVTFGSLARLWSAAIIPNSVEPGGIVVVTLCWQALSATPQDYSVFVHLLGPADIIVGDRNTFPGLGSFGTSLWQAGDTFCDRYDVPVSPGAPRPAIYAVEAGLFDLASGVRQPARAADGTALENVTVGKVKVSGPSAQVPASAVRLEANFADQIELVAYEAGAAQPGADWPLALYWRSLNLAHADYTVFVHLLDASGQIVAQGDGPPQTGRYPTRWWGPREIVRDPHVVPLPAGLPPGAYRAVVGLYSPETGARLALSGAASDSVSLMTLEIK